MKCCCQMLALLLSEVNWISVILCTPKLVSTQLDSYFCIIEERVLPEGYIYTRILLIPLVKSTIIKKNGGKYKLGKTTDMFTLKDIIRAVA